MMFPLASNPENMFRPNQGRMGICRLETGSEMGIRTVRARASFSSCKAPTVRSNIFSRTSASSTSPFLRSVCCSMVMVRTMVSRLVPSGNEYPAPKVSVPLAPGSVTVKLAPSTVDSTPAELVITALICDASKYVNGMLYPLPTGVVERTVYRTLFITLPII